MNHQKSFQSEAVDASRCYFFENKECTGKSSSEALILVSTNPQYEKRLFINLPVHYMKKITNWVHGYLSARVDSGNDFNYVDVRAHGPFYAASQALLYMLAFRYQELVQGKNKRTSDYLFC